MKHSLEDAIADGTIVGESAFTGLSRDELTSLLSAHPTALVKVRLRVGNTDGEVHLAVRDLEDWRRSPTPRALDGKLWYIDDIRDVTAVVNA